jgi:hypothetical protein
VQCVDCIAESRSNPVPATSWTTSKNSFRPSCSPCWGQSCKYVSVVITSLVLLTCIVLSVPQKIVIACLLSGLRIYSSLKCKYSAWTCMIKKHWSAYGSVVSHSFFTFLRGIMQLRNTCLLKRTSKQRKRHLQYLGLIVVKKSCDIISPDSEEGNSEAG